MYSTIPRIKTPATINPNGIGLLPPELPFGSTAVTGRFVSPAGGIVGAVVVIGGGVVVVTGGGAVVDGGGVVVGGAAWASKPKVVKWVVVAVTVLTVVSTMLGILTQAVPFHHAI